MDWKMWRRIGLYAILLVVYLASAVPVGLFIYSIKTEVGLDLFRDGGFHAYMGCLSKSFPLHSKSERVEPSSLTLKQLELLARNAKSAARAAALEAVEYERLAHKLRRQGQVDLQKSMSQ
jgi:hypothetical protein